MNTNLILALLTPYCEIQKQRRELRVAMDACIKRRETERQLYDAIHQLNLDEIQRISKLPEWQVTWPV